MVGFFLFFMAGIANGFMDRVSDKDLYKISIFPQTNHKKWYLSKDYYSKDDSWVRKYKDGDPLKGARFPFSTTLFVAFTDFWHLCQSIMFMCFILAAIFLDVPNLTGTFFDYIFTYMVCVASISGGFTIIYDIITIKN